MKCSIIWYITPFSPLKSNRSFGGPCRLHLQGRRISQVGNRRESRWQAELCFKLEEISSYETPGDVPITTRSYIPEDGTLHNHGCEDLKHVRITKTSLLPCWNWRRGPSCPSSLHGVHMSVVCYYLFSIQESGTGYWLDYYTVVWWWWISWF
jgi:hypothetical protein